MCERQRKVCAAGQAERDEALQFGVALKAWQQEKWAPLTHRHSQEPLGLAVMTDAWGAMVRDTRTADMRDEGLRITRKGRFRHEYLLMRAVMRCRPRIGGQVMFQKIGVPRGLKLGKEAVNVYNVGLDSMPMLKECGHKNISVTLYVEDGLLHSALKKLQSGRHQRYCEQLFFEDGEMAQQVVDTDWVLFLKCTSHPCSNSIKTATRRLRPTDDVVESLHVVTSSYIKGSAVLFDHLDLFLLQKVDFAKPTSSFEDRRAFWTHFTTWNGAATPAILTDLVQIDPRWDPETGRFLVNEDIQSDPKAMQKLHTLCFFGLRWKVWSDTRWCGATVSSKLLVRSWTMGSEPLAELTLADPTVSGYYLNGIRQATHSVKKLAVVLSFACIVPDAVQFMFLEDDRFLRIAGAARSKMCEKMGELCGSVVQASSLRVRILRPLDLSRFIPLMLSVATCGMSCSSN